MSLNVIIYWVLAAVALGSLIYFYRFRKRKIEELFTQVAENSKQVPKQKRNSFILWMFKESVLSSKKKSKVAPASNARLNNPKYIEIQLIQMSKILKSDKKIKDKTMRRALNLLKDFQKWEKLTSEKK